MKKIIVTLVGTLAFIFSMLITLALTNALSVGLFDCAEWHGVIIMLCFVEVVIYIATWCVWMDLQWGENNDARVPETHG